jgi:hypothetical protein
MFGETLALNCDSTTTLNFRGDFMNDTSFQSKEIDFMLSALQEKQYQGLKEKVDQYSKGNNSDLKFPRSYKKFKKK